MCCGVEQNAYHTLHSMKFMLPSGTVIDTSPPDADEQFHAREPQLARGVLELKAQLEQNAALRERVRRKYRMKNTTGYSLNAFLDFDKAVDIFQHVIIGSEGTLAFIAEAVLNTVPDLPVKYTGLLLFPDLYAAAASIVPLAAGGRQSAGDHGSRVAALGGDPERHTCLRFALCRREPPDCWPSFNRRTRASARNWRRSRPRPWADFKLYEPAQFTHHAAEQALLWKIRSGMFPSVGSVRKSGTTVIIEDVAFPVEHLADAAHDLTVLFRKHEYDNAIIFGHAKDGNLHFVITQSFNNQAVIDQYARFIDDVVEVGGRAL